MQVTEMDLLVEEVAKAKSEIKDIQEEIEALELAIKDKLSRVHAYFLETKREEPYHTKHGTFYLKDIESVIQPKGEKLRDIFEHFKKLHGEEHAWTIMTINNLKLKSEIKAHNQAVEERGGDPILEPFPGIESPKITQVLVYKKGTTL